jgi:hypothetical protein
MEAYQLVQKLEDTHWRIIKEKELKEIIEACAGLYLEVSANSASGVPNTSVEINFEVLNRSRIAIELTSVTSTVDKKMFLKDLDLEANKKVNFKETITLATTEFSDPYWLKKEASLGMYSVEDQLLIGNPETSRPVSINFNLTIEGIPITITKNVVRRYAERDIGEIYEPFEVLPKVTTKLKDKVLIFSNDMPQKVVVEVRAGANNVVGTIKLEVPEGWKVSTKAKTFRIKQKGDTYEVNFLVFPTVNQSEGKLKVIVTSNGKIYNKELVEINYKHIPKQAILLTSGH